MGQSNTTCLYNNAKYTDQKKSALYDLIREIKNKNAGMQDSPCDYVMSTITDNGLRTYKQAKTAMDLIHQNNIFILNIVQSKQRKSISEEDYNLLYEYQRATLINNLNELSYDVFKRALMNDARFKAENKLMKFLKGL